MKGAGVGSESTRVMRCSILGRDPAKRRAGGGGAARRSPVQVSAALVVLGLDLQRGVGDLVGVGQEGSSLVENGVGVRVGAHHQVS